MRREPVALGQFAARDSFTDCIRQTLIDWSIVVRQFQIFEHTCLASPSVLVFVLLTWGESSDNATCPHRLRLHDSIILQNRSAKDVHLANLTPSFSSCMGHSIGDCVII